ncbi:hypothetical protein [Simkania sp.]|uniref:hypothetical protein n=1 Tax=Simkania sp. TaxID=34094 RepID=UPI003B527C87
MSEVPRVSSSERVSHHDSGGIGKPPPPKSPHSEDTLSPHQEANSGGGISSTLSSVVSTVFDYVMSGVWYIWSIIRFPFEAMGFLSPTEEIEEEKPAQSMEEKKEGMRTTFTNATHAERFKLLIFNLAVWEDPTAESFFIELFNKQDEGVIVALAKRLMRGLGKDLETTKAEMPELLFRVFSKKKEDRSFSEEKLIEDVHAFLLEFPDYLLTYVATSFEHDAPSWSKFQALERLAAYHDGRAEDFHVKTIDEKGVREAFSDAFSTYYGMLTQEEKEKLLMFVGSSELKSAEEKLVDSIVEECHQPGMDEIFSEQTGYPDTGEQFQERFKAFLNFLVKGSPNEWASLKFRTLEKFETIRKSYFQKLDEAFLSLPMRNRMEVCHWAYESEPAIFKIRLEVLATSDNQEARKEANSLLFRDNYEGVMQLFDAYRDVKVGDKGGDLTFYYEWQRVYNFETREPINYRDFCKKLEGLLLTPEYKGAAQKVLDQRFPKEKDTEVV